MSPLIHSLVLDTLLTRDWGRYRPLIDQIKTQFPCDDFEFPEKTVVLRFSEGIDMLRGAGYKDEGSEEEPSYHEDLSTAGERKLGELVKEKYGTDYYILGG